ncbi:MAG: hypothetical protein LBV26_05330 [Bacteroidales bacterium]|jgi:translation elongation factor EF-1beta|nr:hypothetical protein [Bacteroidales bacterium]
MTAKMIQKRFSCKNEELTVIGGYLLTSIKRDSSSFAAFSPVYGEEGIKAFEQKVKEADALVNPKSETNELRRVTEMLYAELDTVIEKARRIEGYIMMCKEAVPVSAKYFGLTALKQRARVRDAEGALDNLKFVNANIAKYRDALKEKGMPEELAAYLADAAATISHLNHRQYEASAERKAIVNNNTAILNELYDSVSEICCIGKILFMDNKAKMKEYTFNNLKKHVHIVKKIENTDENNSQQPAE